MTNELQELAAVMQLMNQDSGLGELGQLMQLQSGMAQEQRAQEIHPLQMQGAEQALMLALAQQQAGEQQQVFDNQFAQDQFGFAQDQFGLTQDQFAQDVAAEQRLNAFRQMEAERANRALDFREQEVEPTNALRMASAAELMSRVNMTNSMGMGGQSDGIPAEFATRAIKNYFDAQGINVQ